MRSFRFNFLVVFFLCIVLHLIRLFCRALRISIAIELKKKSEKTKQHTWLPKMIRLQAFIYEPNSTSSCEDTRAWKNKTIKFAHQFNVHVNLRWTGNSITIQFKSLGHVFNAFDSIQFNGLDIKPISTFLHNFFSNLMLFYFSSEKYRLQWFCFIYLMKSRLWSRMIRKFWRFV